MPFLCCDRSHCQGWPASSCSLALAATLINLLHAAAGVAQNAQPIFEGLRAGAASSAEQAQQTMQQQAQQAMHAVQQPPQTQQPAAPEPYQQPAPGVSQHLAEAMRPSSRCKRRLSPCTWTHYLPRRPGNHPCLLCAHVVAFLASCWGHAVWCRRAARTSQLLPCAGCYLEEATAHAAGV